MKSEKKLTTQVKWEEEIFNLLQRFNDEQENRDDIAQEIVETVEDLVIVAYLRGRKANEVIKAALRDTEERI